jgi:hypothetical protein
MQLDFSPLRGPENWAKPVGGMGVEETLSDACPGSLLFRGSEIDLSPGGPVAFFGFIAPFCRALLDLAERSSVEFKFADYSKLLYRLERRSTELVQIIGPSGKSATLPVVEILCSLVAFVDRVIRELEPRDGTIDQNVVVRRVLRDLQEQRARTPVPVLTEVLDASGELDHELLRVVARNVENLCWSYGGFHGVSINPLQIEVLKGPLRSVRTWDGSWSGGRPLVTCSMPLDVSLRDGLSVIAGAVAAVLSSCGFDHHIMYARLVALSASSGAVADGK